MLDEIRYKSVAKQVGLLLDNHSLPSDRVVVTVADIEQYGREIQRLTVQSIVNSINPPAPIKNGMTNQEKLLQRKEMFDNRIESFRRKLSSGHQNDTAMKAELVALEAELTTIEAQI